MRRVNPNALHNQSIASPMSGYASSGITMLRGIDRLESIELIIPVGPGGPPFPYERTEFHLAAAELGGRLWDSVFLALLPPPTLVAQFLGPLYCAFGFAGFAQSTQH